MYPSSVDDASFGKRLYAKFVNAPFYVTAVDVELDDLSSYSLDNHSYTAGIVQGYQGVVYVLSYNSYMFAPF